MGTRSLSGASRGREDLDIGDGGEITPVNMPTVNTGTESTASSPYSCAVLLKCNRNL